MSSLASILLVESDEQLIQQLTPIFHQLNSTLTVCKSLTETFAVIDLTKYDLVLACREMPDGDGLEVVEYLNETALTTKVIISSSTKTSPKDRVEVYQAGACDFLAKPLDLTECKYKISMLLRLQKLMPNTTLNYATIKLNPDTGTLYLGETHQTHLRKKESAILTCLLRHRPKIVTKAMIIDYVWGECENPPTYSTIDVYVRRLRTHLGSDHDLIKTARGFGYYLAK